MFELPQVIKNKADLVAGQMLKQKVPQAYAFDFMLILMIGSLIIEIAKCLVKNKRDTQEMFETIQKPNYIQKRYLHKVIKNEFAGTDYEQYIEEIYTAMLTEGSMSELDDVITVLKVGASA